MSKISAQGRINMSIGQMGKKHSEFTKLKISNTLKRIRPKRILNCCDCRKQIFNRKAVRCRPCSRIALRGKPQKYRDMKGINSPAYKNGVTLKNYFCSVCNVKICCKSAVKGTGLCKSCVVSGSRSALYIHGNGYNKYPKEFKESLKEKIRTRDNYVCQNCGMTSEEHIIIYGTEIEVHHIDHHRENCSKENLITLCKQDNLRANKNIQYWVDFYKEKIRVMYV